MGILKNKKRLLWIIIALVSFVSAIIINFNSEGFLYFVTYSLLTALISFLLLYVLINIFINLISKNYKGAVTYLIILAVLLISYLIYFMFSSFFGVSIGGWYFMPRTNIFTGKCGIIQSKHGGGYPWYYVDGCSSKGKVELCKSFCESKNKSYCDDIYFDCQEIAPCKNINCNKSL